MRVLCRFLCFCWVFLLFQPTPVFSQTDFIITDGLAAIISGNIPAARDKAIDDALRKAVEQAVGTLVSSNTLTEQYKVIHDKILAQTTGYVQRYKILSEKPEGEVYRVKIQAEVGRANLTNDLRALGLLHVLAEKPKVMVIMEEKVMGVFGTTAFEDVGQAESTLIQRLLAAGFNVVDPQTVKANISRDQALRILEGDNNAAAAAGLQYGAQIVISGKAFSKNAGGRLLDTQLQSLQATLQARAIRTDSAKIISSRSEQGRQAHIDEVQGGALAIKQAMERMATPMINDILAQWRSEAYGRSREITLVVTRLVSYRHLSAIKTFLEKGLQGVRAVHQRSFIAGSAELMLDYGGKSSHIADELANRKFTGFRLEPTNVTPSRVDVKAVLEK
ncbi:MAG: flagellar assembly protein T N-terminal domain-containing protein [Pseudomonadota bacterium]